jgi:pimeloyl-ACP methyl ester carboxylesterase
VKLERKQSKELKTLAADWWEARPTTRFLDWDATQRVKLEQRARELGPIPEGGLEAVVEILWAAAQKGAGKPNLKKGRLTIETPYGEAWCHVVKGAKKPALLIGLHGGGAGAGSADEARSNWTRKGVFGIYPQGIELVDDTWNTVHGERFVLTLIEMAKLHWKVDPQHVYVTGFSMGGSGSWFLAGRHADLFAGAAPFAGVLMAAPRAQLATKQEVRAIQHGLVPNVRNLAMAYTIGLQDTNCMPGTYLFVADRLAQLAAGDPGGYGKIRFTPIEGLAHAFPPGEPAGALDYLLGEQRDAFPQRVVWEYVTDPSPQPGVDAKVSRLQKPFFYWLGCAQPIDRQTITATRDGNEITLETAGRGSAGVTLFLNPEMIDLELDVVVKSGDRELYRGRPVPDVWTALESLDARLDRAMVFDRRIDL